MNLRTAIDQMGREVSFSFPPKRIISLVPSQTEYLIDIGAPVVGRTKFCIHPKPTVQEITIIGGTKNYRFDQIQELKPDLIIGNKEENDKEGVEELERSHPVWMSDINSLEDAFAMMNFLGSICRLEKQSVLIVDQCKDALNKVKATKKGRVLYLIWKNPWMAAGHETFIDHLLTHLGYDNVVKDSRYPKLSEDQIFQLKPDHIFFSSEPFPFKKKHFEEIISFFPTANCRLVDGELYSWYGSRLKYWCN